jgi:hypothetical protein
LGIFNTAYVARHVFAPLDSMLKLCLGQLLTRLEILCRKIHCAGSDANFALCALLLLAAESYRGVGAEMDDATKEAAGENSSGLALPHFCVHLFLLLPPWKKHQGKAAIRWTHLLGLARGTSTLQTR